MAEREVHEDPYPSRFAMEAAVELEVHACLGRVQTQTVGKVIQRAITKALVDSGVQPPLGDSRPPTNESNASTAPGMQRGNCRHDKPLADRCDQCADDFRNAN